MQYIFNTNFKQLDIHNTVVGGIDLHCHLETDGYFDCGNELYRDLLGNLLECLESYEEEVSIHAR